jgi:YVTN family beta-propeller protein
MKIFSISSLLFFSTFSFASKSHYAIDHRIQLEGAEGWDCLSIDSSSDRLFVTRGNHVDVVDLKTEKVVGKISEPIDGAHAVAFVPSLKKGYITSGKTAKVVVFDLASLKVLKEIPAGKKPDTIAFDESNSRVFSFNGGDNTVTVIDAKTDTVLKTLQLDGKPEFAVVDKGVLYLNDEDKNAIHVIDTNQLNVKKTWALKGCNSPSGLSADFHFRRLFSVCENEVMVVTDADTGKLIKTLPIGKGPDGSVFDSGFAFSSNGAGTLTVVQEKNPKSFDVLENVETQKGARTMTVDPKTHTLYLVAAKYEEKNPKTPEARPKIIPGSVELLVIKK